MSGLPVAAGRPPLLVGQVRSIVATAPAAGDVPWWAKAIGALAVSSLAVAVLAVFAVRTMFRALAGSTKKRKGGILGMFAGGVGMLPGGGGGSAKLGLSKVLLLSGLAGSVGFGLGRREKPSRHSLLMIASSSGTVPCRYPADPGELPIAVGDQVQLLAGRLYPDNTARAWRCRNASTGADHRARLVAAWVPFVALASFALYVYVAIVLLSAGA